MMSLNKVALGALPLAASTIFLAVLAGQAAGRPDRASALASLVEAERAFSRTSEEKGIREAFLTWLAPDAIVFRPGPVEGRPVYEKMDPANPAVLTWGPEIADVSASGELGYTSGPYELRSGRGAEPTGFGHYVSIWKRQPDGAWRVILDAGIPHGPQGPPPREVEDLGPPGAGDAPELGPEALRGAEYDFGRKAAGAFEEQAGRDGQRSAFKEFAAEGIRAYRPGRPPLLGKPALLELVPAAAGRVSPRSNRRRATFRVGIAWSGDLAYHFGTFEFRKDRAAVETTANLQIWRREPAGAWEIVLDLELPVPRDDGQKN